MHYEIGGGMVVPNKHLVLTDDYLLTSKLTIPCNEIDTISNLVGPGPLANGVVTVTHKGKSHVIPYAKRDANKVKEFIDHVEELRRQRLEAVKSPAASPAAASPADEIKKYKELMDMGVISQEEFETKKKQLLNL